jgi:predicted nucleotidyltransferase
VSEGIHKTDDPAFEVVLVRALRDALRAIEAAGVDVLVVGALAMTAYRRDSWPVGGGDIDLLVRQQDAQRAQDALVEAGFRREPTSERWLLKAMRDHVLVDMIFVAGYSMPPDDEMMRRGRESSVAGVPVRAIAPEDYIVMQSLATKRAATGYWFDALRLIDEVRDWDYVMRRGETNPARLASLLAFAIADGIGVPMWVVDELLVKVRRMPGARDVPRIVPAYSSRSTA